MFLKLLPWQMPQLSVARQKQFYFSILQKYDTQKYWIRLSIQVIIFLLPPEYFKRTRPDKWKCPNWLTEKPLVDSQWFCCSKTNQKPLEKYMLHGSFMYFLRLYISVCIVKDTRWHLRVFDWRIVLMLRGGICFV